MGHQRASKAAEEAASRADTFREQLLGVVGHDLRTPLNTIQLSVAALQRDGELDERQARQVTIMWPPPPGAWSG